METLRSTTEQIKPLSEYKYTEIINSIYEKVTLDGMNLDTELSNLSFQKEKEVEVLKTIITSFEKQSSNPRINKQINVLQQKVVETQASKQKYEMLKELNLYRLEGGLDLESNSVEFLLERYRAYQQFLNTLEESEYNLAKTDIGNISESYYSKTLEIIDETGIDKKYGFRYAEPRPVSIEELSNFIIPDTENSEFNRYIERTRQITQGNYRFLNDGQETNMTNDLKGSDSERIVSDELIQVPGVLATIDIPKFSIGDTRHKADTIAITLNPKLLNSLNEKDIQLAIYKLIEEYKQLLLEHMIQQGENSLINRQDNILGDIIRVNRNIKLDNISSELKNKNIDLSQILQMHNIQIKTKASDMSIAFEGYKKSKLAINPDKVGFLAKEYNQPGNPRTEDFNKIHFQIAAQTVLGLPIK